MQRPRKSAPIAAGSPIGGPGRWRERENARHRVAAGRRGAGRLLALLLFGALGLISTADGRAATIPVGAGCTLVEAITAANDDLAVGSCPAGSGADTLALGADVTLTIFHNTTDGDNALPSVTSEIIVEGNGFTIARSDVAGTPRFRLFHVASGGDLTLRDLTVANGYAHEGGSQVHRGGGIYNLGDLTLDAAIVGGNRVAPQAGSPALTNTALGGGIYNAGTLTIENGSRVSANLAAGDGDTSTATPGDGHADGGGIYSAAGSSLTVIASSILSNLARSTGGLPRSRGGGVYSEAAATTVVDSTLEFNVAFCDAEFAGEARGGGWMTGPDAGPLTVTGSIFKTNGADCESGDAWGGGLFVGSEQQVSATNSTFFSNLARVFGGSGYAGGGAILASGAAVALTHVTLAANQALSPSVGDGGAIRVESGAVTLVNSIVADSNPAPPGDCSGIVGSLIDGTGNFGCFALAPAVTGLAGAASANGGPTETHQLSASSNAVNAGGSCGLALDQRGVSRIAACDSGAYELNPCTVEDAYESQGSGASDDTCFGSPLDIGTARSHSHCDPDWVFFSPDIGKRYEVRTLDLINGADTVVEVSRGCGAVVEGRDDDGGPGPASRVVFTAAASVFHDVEIRQAHDSYNPGPSPPATVEGYDVMVRCIGGCDCAPPEGPDLELSDDEVSAAVTYEACSVIRADDWTVETPGAVVLRAGDSVVFREGVAIHGSLEVEIDPALLPPP